MARVPAYPYRVVVYRKPIGANPPQIENHNYTDLPGAIAYRSIALGKHTTKRVEVVMVLDESTPDHRDSVDFPINGHRLAR
jgi:hypothetical protein